MRQPAACCSKPACCCVLLRAACGLLLRAACCFKLRPRAAKWLIMPRHPRRRLCGRRSRATHRRPCCARRTRPFLSNKTCSRAAAPRPAKSRGKMSTRQRRSAQRASCRASLPPRASKTQLQSRTRRCLAPQPHAYVRRPRAVAVAAPQGRAGQGRALLGPLLACMHQPVPVPDDHGPISTRAQGCAWVPATMALRWQTNAHGAARARAIDHARAACRGSVPWSRPVPVRARHAAAAADGTRHVPSFSVTRGCAD